MSDTAQGFLDILKSELDAAVAQLRAQVTDPDEQVNLAAMAHDLGMLPVRLARGEDVAGIVAALTAEGQNRALTHRTLAALAVQTAWQRAIGRILLNALAVVATA